MKKGVGICEGLVVIYLLLLGGGDLVDVGGGIDRGVMLGVKLILLMKREY